MMGDQSSKKRKYPWKNAYSTMTKQAVQEGYQLDEEPFWRPRTTYIEILRYLRFEDYPMESPDFKEGNVNDLVLLIVLPVIGDPIPRTGRDKVRLIREKQIVVDGLETGGEEFVVIDEVELGKERYSFIEAKRYHLELRWDERHWR